MGDELRDMDELYERVKECKKQGLSDEIIVIKLLDKNTSSRDILGELKEYNNREKLASHLKVWARTQKIVNKHNEYGIPMIDKDEDW